MTHGLSFVEGATHADMMHAAGAAARAESQTSLIRSFMDRIRRTEAARDRAINDCYARNGMIAILQEEAQLAAQLGTDNRFSGPQNKRTRFGAWDELEKLAKIDRDLAGTGGRFSGRRIDNLREVLYMRIDEFFEYGEKHQLLHPNTRTVYSDDLKKSMNDDIQQKSRTIGRSPESVEILMLQYAMNKMYAKSYDANGERPEDYDFKPVNLIAAVGLTVKQLCEAADIEESSFVGQPLADPPFDRSIFDKANDEAANVLQVEYAALENEVDIMIRGNKLMPPEEAEKTIENVNKSFPDLKSRVAAKISIVKYLEVQAAIRPPEPKSPGAGQ